MVKIYCIYVWPFSSICTLFVFICFFVDILVQVHPFICCSFFDNWDGVINIAIFEGNALVFRAGPDIVTVVIIIAKLFTFV